MSFAARMGQIAPSPTLKVAAEADRLRRQGVDVVDLGAGEPDFPTPEHVKAAAHAALDQNFTKYTPSAGIPELREAVCQRYALDYEVAFRPEEVIITAGGKQALYNTAMVLFDPGDEVVTHAPYWPTIPEQVKLAGATPVIVQTSPEDGFAIHPEAILAAVSARTKAIIINSPSNPAGALISEEDLAVIADEAARRGIWVIADLTYERLIYDPVAHNLPRVLIDRLPDRSVICSAASKAYAMTGWRCGWTIGPSTFVAQCNALQGHSTSNVNSITQKAAIAALLGPQEGVTMMLDEYRRRRDSVWQWLTSDPRITCVKPRGAFYLFPYVADVLEATGLRTTNEFAEVLLAEARVAVTAGEGLDAPGFFRLSYATSMERLKEGTDRLHAFIERRSARRQDAAASRG
ncbi:MAG TPA: pyridoxal phosphate-dependent aminotransferase [Vicinamibacterales bacterium]|nr:pyridoxal phosphate-dependent aminotransferase [Vicinamibacterales bacterium]